MNAIEEHGGVVLITAFSHREDPQRIDEYATCLKINCENRDIAKVIVFLEGGENDRFAFDGHEKAEVIAVTVRGNGGSSYEVRRDSTAC